MNLIVAVDANNAIGENNNLLDHFHADLKYFKEKTEGKVVVMGKNTFLSLPKRPLPNRVNIILSSSMEPISGCIICKNIEELFSVLDNYDDGDIFVIGGAKIYSELYPYCNKFYITRIFKIYSKADKFFNEMEEIKNLKKISSNTLTENNIMLDFLIYERDI